MSGHHQSASAAPNISKPDKLLAAYKHLPEDRQHKGVFTNINKLACGFCKQTETECNSVTEATSVVQGNPRYTSKLLLIQHKDVGLTCLFLSVYKVYQRLRAEQNAVLQHVVSDLYKC